MKQAFVSAIVITLGVPSAGADLGGAPEGAAVRPTATPYTVVLIGDDSRSRLLAGLASAHEVSTRRDAGRETAEVWQGGQAFRLIVAEDDRPETQARLCWSADAALIAVDATKGLLRLHRESAVIARQMAVPHTTLVLTNASQVSDPELLALVKLEVADWIESSVPPGGVIEYAVDEAAVKIDAESKLLRGAAGIIGAIADASPGRCPGPPGEERRKTRAHVRVFAGRAIDPAGAEAVGSGSWRMICDGETYSVDVTAPQPIEPGQRGKVEITFPEPVHTDAGRRVLLLRKSHVAAAGILLQETDGADPADDVAGETTDAPTAADGPTADDARFDVVLEEVGGNKIHVIKIIRGLTGLHLKEAKERAESAPVVLGENLPCDAARALERQLEVSESGVTGARASIRPAARHAETGEGRPSP